MKYRIIKLSDEEVFYLIGILDNGKGLPNDIPTRIIKKLRTGRSIFAKEVQRE